MRKKILFCAGFVLIALGISCVLRDWQSVVTVFKGVFGPGLAVAGLVVLFAATLKES